MLVLRRKDGQWIEVTHRSGDVLRFRVCDVSSDGPGPGRVNLAFDDEARNFSIQRPERIAVGPPFPIPPRKSVGFIDGYLGAGPGHDEPPDALVPDLPLPDAARGDPAEAARTAAGAEAAGVPGAREGDTAAMTRRLGDAALSPKTHLLILAALVHLYAERLFDLLP